MRSPLSILVLAILAVSPVFAGCLGDDEGAPPATSAEPGATGTGDPAVNASGLDGNVTVDDGSGAFSEGDAGHLPHVHDYWNGREKVTIFDDTASFEALNQYTFFALFAEQRASAGATFVQLPDGSTVHEGTGKMMFTASWTDQTITGVQMRYRHASSRDFEGAIPIVSGETLEIEVTPDMTDMAHQQSSRWAFYLFAGGGAADVAQGNIHLTIDIVRVRDIHVLPGHPVTYANTNEYEIMNVDAHSRNYNLATFAAAQATGSYSDDWVPPQDIVRMGTRAILAEVHVSNAAGSAVSDVSGVRLEFRSAMSSFRSHRAEMIPTLSDPDAGKFTFGILVSDGMVDGPYEKESLWRFKADPQETVATGNTCRWVCGGSELEYHITVTTYNEDPTDGQIPDRNEQ